MDNLNSFENFVNKHFKISLIFLFLAFVFGILYSTNLLGFYIDSQTLNPANIRSLHISLMLYGFVPLMLSYLPFLLINKEGVKSAQGLRYLSLYTIFWYIFLVFMISSLLFGNTRGLAFYDFPYELNFILAISGVFYILALYKYIKAYEKVPLWIKVCLRITIIAPIALLILMNPTIGQVESTISGPHGDNTLGMSLALIPIYYLIIKLLNKTPFVARWNILWMIPTFFYFSSVLYRSFIGHLTYEMEWFCQWLTLLYIPILYRWYKDADIETFAKKALLVSILAFLFVDIEGNILFIPEFRWLFHRNDLIVAHAHVAMGIGVFFMVIAMFVKYVKELKKFSFYAFYIGGLLGIFAVLSISGFIQAGVLSGDITTLWALRTVFGFITMFSIFSFISFKFSYTPLQKYNLFGVLADGLGGVFLILLASFLYPIFGFKFSGSYEYIVFAFVSVTGIIHFFALIYKQSQKILTKLTVITRVLISSIFFALFYNKTLGIEALLISLFDITYASIYLLFFYKKDILCQK
ncbi:hypothetical protein [Halarcobacter ebronensis]|uniref:Cytochrome oxidase subunit I profile domain-containing protein n=1 Tax=Halarcobacter ebronensis TaxID=1462615 RepID=A0A4Q1ATF1_9BACT|nr:hypothetical protein [Halarcobacter ebronensis]QKF83490.1 putative membrane protein [Halarcobacter ebronensis]RXK08286.1 hypothetical protein CRV07_00320 [Halarcobacter ebronensis]